MGADDPFDLERFLRAQAEIFPVAMAELRAGAKRSHWMWFVFPQLAGLGTSAMSRRFAIGSLAEAKAFLGHPMLGPRYRMAVRTLLDLPGSAIATTVFGPIDAMKLRSSLTLFALAAPDEPALEQARDRFFPEGPCQRTLNLLAHNRPLVR
jgi:uncharacterized protein (DUF1810 family)